MIETNPYSTHIAGIIPIAGNSLGFNMPWNDSLTPVGENYHAIERAAHSAALAGCDTIWVVLYRETQPLIRQKLGEWIYDPKYVWKSPDPFMNKREIPIYYIAINPRDRERRDSFAWSTLYGAKVSSYISLKISKWVIPKRFLVVSPFGIVDDNTMKSIREVIRGTKNICLEHESNTFLNNNYSPFTFTQDEYIECKKNFKEMYIGNETKRTFAEVFQPIDISSYIKIKPSWFYKIDNWNSYTNFLSTSHSKECVRPKYMVTHKWWGLVKDH